MDTNQDKSVDEAAEEKEETEEDLEADEGEAETTEEMTEEPEEAPNEEETAEETEEKTPEEEPETTEEAAAEEEERKPSKEAEEEIVEERIYTIPLSRAWIAPRKKRTPRAVRIVKTFIQKHMKIEAKPVSPEEEEEGGKLVISDEVNRRLWKRGIEKPPRNIRVRAVKDKEGVVTLYLAEGD